MYQNLRLRDQHCLVGLHRLPKQREPPYLHRSGLPFRLVSTTRRLLMPLLCLRLGLHQLQMRARRHLFQHPRGLTWRRLWHLNQSLGLLGDVSFAVTSQAQTTTLPDSPGSSFLHQMSGGSLTNFAHLSHRLPTKPGLSSHGYIIMSTMM
jgi:hypothetical protein